MRTRNPYGKSVLAGVTAALVSLGTAHAGVSVLHTFTGGRDGANPTAGLIEDASGNLYGTTFKGGYGYGTVFKLAPDSTETILYAFTGGSDGRSPSAGLIRDQAGNLYGTTTSGGAQGYGTVFKLAPNGREKVLHAFTIDGGEYPNGLIQDNAGNLYGTTYDCGLRCDLSACCGAVFELTRHGIFVLLYAFTGENGDGAHPAAGLIRDEAGNLYGTTTKGGDADCYHYGSGCGTVFKVAPDGTETVLYAFAGRRDGIEPAAGLINDKAGNLYGTTEFGGPYAHGMVFKLAPDGTETTLHAFTGENGDGAQPVADLIRDKAGNLYGTTSQGGGNGCGGSGCGTVFKLAPDGTETVLYAFRKHEQHRGSLPYAGLIKGDDGQLYGTTYEGGTDCSVNADGCGTVFRLKK